MPVYLVFDGLGGVNIRINESYDDTKVVLKWMYWCYYKFIGDFKELDRLWSRRHRGG